MILIARSSLFGALRSSVAMPLTVADVGVGCRAEGAPCRFLERDLRGHFQEGESLISQNMEFTSPVLLLQANSKVAGWEGCKTQCITNCRRAWRTPQLFRGVQVLDDSGSLARP
jgi:hypothetical protein